MTRWLLVVVAAAILVLTGVVHGLRTDRWWVSETRKDLAARVPTVPLTVGAWRGEDVPLDERQLKLAQADAHLSRRYSRDVPGRGRREVSLILLSGRAQPMAVHTPDVCFANIGYKMDGPARVYTPLVDGQRRDGFWQGRFSKDAEPASQRVYWAWSGDGRWVAADNPRGEFSRHRALCKLYLVCTQPRTANADDLDPAQELLTDLLPELHRSLVHP